MDRDFNRRNSMLGIFQAVAGRLKAMFLTHVSLDLEAELLAQDAVRKAGLLRQADQYAAEGLKDVAAELRERVGRLSMDRPLASVLPAVEEFRLPDDVLVKVANVAAAARALTTVSSKRR